MNNYIIIYKIERKKIKKLETESSHYYNFVWYMYTHN